MSGQGLFSLRGKRALVTGATRGMGRAIAEQMALAGADVVIYSNEVTEPVEGAQEIGKIGVRTLGLICDVEQSGDIDDLADKVLAVWCGLDILVCNAGAN